MSFYLTLSSDGCKETFPNNHGGDFKIQLDRTLDMRLHAWEVALTDMIYTGQSFPNLLDGLNQVTLKATGKPTFENHYFITYDQTLDLHLTFKLDDVGIVRKYADFYLPRQHYTWATFVDTFRKLCIDKFKMLEVNLTHEEFIFRDINRRLISTFTMTMSDDFINLFGIDKNYVQINDYAKRQMYFKLPITKIPQPVADTSLAFFTPFSRNNNCIMKVEDEEIFKLTPQYWTINMFKKAINALGKCLPPSSWLSSMSIEDENTIELCTLVLEANQAMKGDREYINVKVTYDFKEVFKFNRTNDELLFSEPLRIPIYFMLSPQIENLWKDYEASKRMPNIFYSSVNALCDELNKVLMELHLEIGQKRLSSTEKHDFFLRNEDKGVSYIRKKNFTVLLSVGLSKLLHLPRLLPNYVDSTEAVALKPHRRTHYYIHLDCLDYHYINNNVSDLIKVLPNTADEDEKVMLTFNDPHYYPVARRLMSNINMYVTDSYFNGFLFFNCDIAYTLHFRKCLHSS